MFFWLSKVLAFLLSPFLWIVVLMFVSFLLKNKKRKKKFIIATVIVTIFFSNNFIVDEFIRLWEVPQKTIKTGVIYDAGIVLGGGMVTYDVETGETTFRHNTDRIMQALHLFKAGRIERIIISGGSGSLIHKNVLEACLLRDFLFEIGFDYDKMWAECESNNTYENAVKTAKLLKEKNLMNGKFLLITSAFHIRRAKACFEKQKINVDIYPTNRITGKRRYDAEFLLVPSTTAINKWEMLLKEIIGMVTYKIMGYI